MTTCKKVSFCDERYADEYISKLNKTSKRKLKPVRSYLCDKCLTWHITSIEQINYKLPRIEQERLVVKEQKQKEYEQRWLEIAKQKQEEKYNKLNNKYNQLCQSNKKLKEEYLLFKISVSILIM
jgi:hypothetical protein